MTKIDKQLDHIYHRSRIDAHITGMIILVTLMAILSLTIGPKFAPFKVGARMLDSVRYVWVEADQEWVTEHTLVRSGTFPPIGNRGETDIREVYPKVVSLVLFIGVMAVSGFIYKCARRQTRLMNQIYADDPDRPYYRPWSEIRITFWALNFVLLFVMMLMFFL
ncbi:MAG TPA: hypothetical protein PKN33_16320 [Phycisphaerae bacterium]|nr:hypothetical protein [Phycisphaerales bacterium]HNO79616.1 hypothetical protein [Phycisphaerae bacterium]